MAGAFIAVGFSAYNRFSIDNLFEDWAYENSPITKLPNKLAYFEGKPLIHLVWKLPMQTTISKTR